MSPDELVAALAGVLIAFWILAGGLVVALGVLREIRDR